MAGHFWAESEDIGFSWLCPVTIFIPYGVWVDFFGRVFSLEGLKG